MSEAVEPARQVQDRQVELGHVFGGRDAAPVRVLGVIVVAPVPKPRRQLTEPLEVTEGPVLEQRPRGLGLELDHLDPSLVIDVPGFVRQPLGLGERRERRGDPAPLRLPHRRPGAPVQRHPEGEDAGGGVPRAVTAPVPHGGERRDRDQVRGSGDRRRPRGHAAVGQPVHADGAVRPRLSRGPLDGVVAVLHVGVDRGEVALGAVPAPTALDHDGVALLGHGLAEHRPDPVTGAVRVAQDQHRKAILDSRGPEHIGAKADAVAHRHHDVVLDDESGIAHLRQAARSVFPQHEVHGVGIPVVEVGRGVAIGGGRGTVRTRLGLAR